MSAYPRGKNLSSWAGLMLCRGGMPLLDWQTAQQEIRDENLTFSWLGIGMWVCGIVMFAVEKFSKKKK